MEIREGCKYIYKTTCLLTNEVYIGKRNTSSKNDKSYLGSGLILQNKIKKYTSKAFKKEILVEGNFNKKLLDSLERHYIRLYSPSQNKLSMNIALGGDGGGRPGVLNSTYRHDIDRDLDYIISSYKSGISLKKLAVEFSCSTDTIKSRIPKEIFRIKGKSWYLQYDLLGLINFCFKGGYTHLEIQKTFDINYDAYVRFLNYCKSMLREVDRTDMSFPKGFKLN